MAGIGSGHSPGRSASAPGQKKQARRQKQRPSVNNADTDPPKTHQSDPCVTAQSDPCVTAQSDPPFGVGFEGVKLGWVLGLFASQ